MYKTHLERILVVATLGTSEKTGKPLCRALRELQYDCRQSNSWHQAPSVVKEFDPHLIFAVWEAEDEGEMVKTLARNTASPTIALVEGNHAIKQVTDYCQKMSPPNQLFSFLAEPFDVRPLVALLHSAAGFNYQRHVMSLM